MSKTPELVVVGSVALDSVRTPHGERERILGGSACYAGMAASYLTRVGLVGVVGEDFPAAHLDLLRGRGLDLEGIYTEVGSTFFWQGYYEGGMNSAITVDTRLGVFERFRPDLPEAYRSAPSLFLANIHPALQLNVLDQMSKKTRVALDTMNYWIKNEPKLLAEVVSKVEIIFINESEIQQFTGIASLSMAAEQVLTQGPQVVVLKRGEHGATVHCAAGVVAAPALPLRTVKDPTGAGDTFAGGFLGYLAQVGGPSTLETLRAALWVGTAMASFTVEDFSLAGLCRADRETILDRCRTLEAMVSGQAPAPRVTCHV